MKRGEAVSRLCILILLPRLKPCFSLSLQAAPSSEVLRETAAPLCAGKYWL